MVESDNGNNSAASSKATILSKDRKLGKIIKTRKQICSTSRNRIY